MSRLAEKLKRIHQGSTSTLGFRRSAEVEMPPLLMIANLTKASVTEVKAMTGSGIDAGIVSGEGVDAKSLAQLTKAMDGAPLGLFWETASKVDIAESINLGYDFVVFDLKTPFTALDKKNLGKVLKIEPTLDQGLVRAINRLPLTIDGVLLTGEDNTITVERLLIYQRFAELLDRPLLVTVNSPLTGGELASLCDDGISGLLLGERFTKESINDMKKSIGGISKSVRRPKAKTAALLPRLSGELEPEAEEVEEEDI